jgi:YHS domain-containing protein
MIRPIQRAACLVGLLFAGCSEPPPGATPQPVSPETIAKSNTTIQLNPTELAAIKKLPEADQAAAIAQKICPISDEHLGSMDTPIKVEANGKSVFLCCAGCEEEFKSDPGKAFAKLGK